MEKKPRPLEDWDGFGMAMAGKIPHGGDVERNGRMIELFREATSPHQLPVTIVLGMMMLYWLMVVLGAVDYDGTMPDVGHTFEDGSHVAGATGGAWVSLGKWLGFSQVPIAVWGSFAVLFAWVVSLLLNAMYNGEPGQREIGRAMLLFVPSCAVSLALTKIVTLPVGRLFAAMADADTEAVEVVGQVGVVVSREVDERYGQLQLAGGGGAPVLLNVRVARGAPALRKGDEARVVSASADGSFHYVEPSVPH
jgi:hypothetical protein